MKHLKDFVIVWGKHLNLSYKTLYLILYSECLFPDDFCNSWDTFAGKLHVVSSGCTFLTCFLLESIIILCRDLKSPGSALSNGTANDCQLS